MRNPVPVIFLLVLHDVSVLVIVWFSFQFYLRTQAGEMVGSVKPMLPASDGQRRLSIADAQPDVGTGFQQIAQSIAKRSQILIRNCLAFVYLCSQHQG